MNPIIKYSNYANALPEIPSVKICDFLSPIMQHRLCGISKHWQQQINNYRKKNLDFQLRICLLQLKNDPEIRKCQDGQADSVVASLGKFRLATTLSGMRAKELMQMTLGLIGIRTIATSAQKKPAVAFCKLSKHLLCVNENHKHEILFLNSETNSIDRKFNPIYDLTGSGLNSEVRYDIHQCQALDASKFVVDFVSSTNRRMIGIWQMEARGFALQHKEEFPETYRDNGLTSQYAQGKIFFCSKNNAKEQDWTEFDCTTYQKRFYPNLLRHFVSNQAFFQLDTARKLNAYKLSDHGLLWSVDLAKTDPILNASTQIVTASWLEQSAVYWTAKTRVCDATSGKEISELSMECEKIDFDSDPRIFIFDNFFARAVNERLDFYSLQTEGTGHKIVHQYRLMFGKNDRVDQITFISKTILIISTSNRAEKPFGGHSMNTHRIYRLQETTNRAIPSLPASPTFVGSIVSLFVQLISIPYKILAFLLQSIKALFS